MTNYCHWWPPPLVPDHNFFCLKFSFFIICAWEMRKSIKEKKNVFHHIFKDTTKYFENNFFFGGIFYSQKFFFMEPNTASCEVAKRRSCFITKLSNKRHRSNAATPGPRLDFFFYFLFSRKSTQRLFLGNKRGKWERVDALSFDPKQNIIFWSSFFLFF